MEKVKFWFDPSDFIKGSKDMSAAILGVLKPIGQVRAAVEKEVGKVEKAWTKAFGAKKKPAAQGGASAPAAGGGKESGGGMELGFLGKAGLLGAAITGFQSLLSLGKQAIGFITSNIPEIGQTIDIVGGILKKNLLAPLRAELLPVLQSILDWAANNRPFFVRLGSVLANVFRTAMIAAKIFYNLLEKTFGEVMKTINKTYGSTTQSIEKTLNILVLKVATVLIFLEPYILKLSKLFGGMFDGLLYAWKEVQSLFSGLMENFKIIQGALKDLFPTGFLEKIEKFIPSLKELGTVLAKFMLAPLLSIVTTFKTFLDILPKLKAGKYTDVLKDVGFLAAQLSTGGLFGIVNEERKAIQGVVEDRQVKKGNDFILTKNGQMIETHPDDNIIASKQLPDMSRRGSSSPASAMGSAVVTIQSIIGQMSLSVTEGNAKAAGENLGEALGKKLREVLMREMNTAGAFS